MWICVTKYPFGTVSEKIAKEAKIFVAFRPSRHHLHTTEILKCLSVTLTDAAFPLKCVNTFRHVWMTGLTMSTWHLSI